MKRNDWRIELGVGTDRPSGRPDLENSTRIDSRQQLNQGGQGWNSHCRAVVEEKEKCRGAEDAEGRGGFGFSNDEAGQRADGAQQIEQGRDFSLPNDNRASYARG
jgi:hypothetical protein